MYRLRDKLGPDRKKAYDESIRRMARGGAVSETEERALLELGKRGFAVGSDAEFEKFRSYARALHKRMMLDPCASPVALAMVGVIANHAVPSPTKRGPRGRLMAKASQHPVRDILLGVAGGAFGGLRMSGGWHHRRDRSALLDALVHNSRGEVCSITIAKNYACELE